jgi:outer membrane protein OmpA-like peptidoglycan-associated protein/osmotically-inducible protein OsmY
MRCNWRRWLWGVIPLVGISVAAVHLERGTIEKDLTARAERALAKNGERWAVVNFSGRDVVLTGNATSEDEPPQAEAILRRLWGVRLVNNNANLPPTVEPFQWSARRRGNRVRLSGYVPDRATRQTIIGMTNASLPGLEVVDRMRTARGVPPADTWLAGLSFALKQLASLKRGEVRLDDLALTVSGEAEDAADYRAVSAALKRGLPKGITLTSAHVAAPVVSPYTWSAQFAGGQLVLSGHVASDAAKAELQAAAATAPAGTDVVDRLETARGAPADFAGSAAALIRQIVKLQSGTAEIKDTLVIVGGVAADEAQAQAVRDGLRGGLPSAFKLTDQIRVRQAPKAEPKVEPKPPDSAPAEPPPPVAPAAAEQHADKGAVSPVPAAEPQPKVAAAAPVAPEARPAEAAPAPAAPPGSGPAPPAPKEPSAPVTLPVPPPPTVVVPSIEEQLAVCRDDLAKLAGANPVTFERGSAEIDAAGREVLARIAAAVKGCPGVRIAAEGHTDVEGIPDYNQRLSVKRAQAVADYLIAAGVGADQVETAGFGASRPIAPNSTPVARAKNRRTEIVVRGK